MLAGLHIDRPCSPEASKPVIPLGYGLEPRSRAAYLEEWKLYLQFCADRGVKQVPGRDIPLTDVRVIHRYLGWRSLRVNVRTIHGIRSKLKHCSLCFNHLLPNAKGEGPTTLRLQLALVTRAIGKRQKRRCKVKGISSDPKRALALGKVAVGLLFSSYGAETRKGFQALNGSTQNWLVMCMHTGCMRFQLLRKLCRLRTIRWFESDQTYRMASD